MSTSPLSNAEGPLRVTLLADGAELSAATQIVSIQVRRAINRVPIATLVFSDGDMPAQCFPLSDAQTFKPGVEVTIKAGYADSEEVIFKGMVVRHGLNIAGGNDARLIVECRDKVVKMTVGRNSAVFEKKKDSDVMSELAQAHGLSCTVETTTVQHEALLQHDCTNWDFMLARAEANGFVVVALDGALQLGAPSTDGAAVLSVGYGESLIDFQADIDSRHQYATVKAQAWSPMDQQLVEASAALPQALTGQGNLSAQMLSGVLGLSELCLRSGAPWSQDALNLWPKAQQLKSALSRVRGAMRFQGSALAQVGALIEVTGVGERFNGKVYVTGLTHHLEDGSWTTKAEFGAPIEWFAERADIMAPPAAGLLPGISGLQAGVVLKLDADPLSQHRVQVKVPSAGLEPVWARLLQFHASNGFGAFFLPEIGDEVLLGFFNDDPGHPVILGSLYSSKNAPPYALEATNNIKALVTRCKSKIEFNEEDKVITVLTPGGNSVVLSDRAKSIVLKDQNNNRVEMNPGGIIMDSPKDIKISAKGTITVEAVGALSMSSKADVKIEGLNVNCTAQVGMVAKGSATAELSASGQTTVKGALVMIN